MRARSRPSCRAASDSQGDADYGSELVRVGKLDTWVAFEWIGKPHAKPDCDCDILIM
jgi:hypothetical protein